MADTFPALLADLLRTDPGRPLVTFYDDATGERVELSTVTYANWVAKTSSLFVEEFDLERGDTLLVDLPTHWLAPVFLGAAWNVGLAVSFDPDRPASLTVCGPDDLERYAARGDTVLASALLPLGVRFPNPLPAGVHDFGAEVWSQPDAFIPWDPPSADDLAFADRTQAQALTPAGDAVPDYVGGGRLLTTANPASPRGIAGFLAPLISGGSGIWVRNADPEGLERRVADERATSRWLA
ncbi:TIGR03089 family protein [Nocardioides jensenii]|uniref:TIGR03089 family protein n=1 Tax=Nocardioides jensenii TaxID=1843 RepID=UPI00083745F6|nr:TIGR03089 family protein [Nocardioides jensenii]